MFISFNGLSLNKQFLSIFLTLYTTHLILRIAYELLKERKRRLKCAFNLAICTRSDRTELNQTEKWKEKQVFSGEETRTDDIAKKAATVIVYAEKQGICMLQVVQLIKGCFSNFCYIFPWIIADFSSLPSSLLSLLYAKLSVVLARVFVVKLCEWVLLVWLNVIYASL